jgi:(p)ppGpp synthase/HD superfamily hydrolase
MLREFLNDLKPVVNNEPSDQIDLAIRICAMGFTGKVRFGGFCPMSLHSIRVGCIVERLPNANTLLVVGGFGHDWYEDLGFQHDQIARLFGSDVADLIQACSYPSPEVDGTPEGNDLLFQQVAAAGKEAIAIKVADITDNLSTLHQVPEKYQSELLRCGRHYLQRSADLPTEWQEVLIPLLEKCLSQA